MLVAVVDDHVLLAQTLAQALRDAGRRVAVVDPDPPDLVARVAAVGARVVLLDLELGTEVSGAHLVRPLVESGAAVVVVTASTDPVDHARCVAAGAAGILHKSQPFEALLSDVEAVLDERELASPEDRDRAAALLSGYERHRRERLAALDSLTPREAVVLGHLRDGHSVTAIARLEVVSVNTVRSQVRAILAKLGVRSQLEAVARARDAGWDRRDHGPR